MVIGNPHESVQITARKRDILAVLAGAAAALEALGLVVGQLGPVVGLLAKLFGLNS